MGRVLATCFLLKMVNNAANRADSNAIQIPVYIDKSVAFTTKYIPGMMITPSNTSYHFILVLKKTGSRKAVNTVTVAIKVSVTDTLEYFTSE